MTRKELAKRVKKCNCSGIPQMVAIKRISDIPTMANFDSGEIKFRLECPDCGNSSKEMNSSEEALINWNDSHTAKIKKAS